MFTLDLEAAIAVLDDEMVAANATIIKGQIRSAIGFELSRSQSGGSYLNGLPQLPDDIPWPESNGYLLQFRASVDMRTLPEFDGWPNRPTTGALLFFAFENHEGVDYEAGGRVIYTPENDLPTRSYPAEFQGELIGQDIMPVDPAMEIPDPLALMGIGHCTPFLSGFPTGGPDEVANELIDDYPYSALSELHREDCALQLLGIAEPVQSNPLPAGPEGWRLLAQIDTRDIFVTYFMIREADLAAQDFSKVQTHSTCD